MNGHCFPGHNKYLLSFSVDVRQSAGEYTYQVYHMHVRNRPTRYCRRTFRYRTSYLTYAKLVRTVPLACSLYNLCLFIDRNFVFPRSVTVLYIRGWWGVEANKSRILRRYFRRFIVCLPFYALDGKFHVENAHFFFNRRIRLSSNSRRNSDIILNPRV